MVARHEDRLQRCTEEWQRTEGVKGVVHQREMAALQDQVICGGEVGGSDGDGGGGGDGGDSG